MLILHFPKLIEINIIYTFFFVGSGYFPPFIIFPRDEMLQTYLYLIAMSMENFRTSSVFQFTFSDIYDFRSTPWPIRASQFTYHYKIICNFIKMNSMWHQATRVFHHTEENRYTAVTQINMKVEWRCQSKFCLNNLDKARINLFLLPHDGLKSRKDWDQKLWVETSLSK